MAGPTPLTRFFLRLSDWGRGLERGLGNEYGTSDALSLFDPFREGAADLMVWLAAQGRTVEADEIDDALCELRDVLRRFDDGDLPAIEGGPDGDDRIEPFEQVQRAIERACGRLEDLDGEIPEAAWTGFDDA